MKIKLARNSEKVSSVVKIEGGRQSNYIFPITYGPIPVEIEKNIFELISSLEKKKSASNISHIVHRTVDEWKRTGRIHTKTKKKEEK